MTSGAAQQPPFRYSAPMASSWTNNFAAAQRDLSLTPQEQNLYMHHLGNLVGPGKVPQPDGSISTILQETVEHDGRTYNIPTVWDGKVLAPKEAEARAGASGWDKWPSYGSEKEAESRYQAMHGYMDADVGSYLSRDKQSPEAPAPSVEVAEKAPDFTAPFQALAAQAKKYGAAIAEPWEGIMAVPESAREVEKATRGTPFHVPATIATDIGARFFNMTGAAFSSAINTGAITVGDLAQRAGVSPESAGRLVNDLRGMPESFFGSPHLGVGVPEVGKDVDEFLGRVEKYAPIDADARMAAARARAQPFRDWAESTMAEGVPRLPPPERAQAAGTPAEPSVSTETAPAEPPAAATPAPPGAAPRGIRNNNPGNLQFAGQAGAEREPGEEGRFAAFPTMEDGVSALARQIRRSAARGNTTVRSLISTYAPGGENDTAGYVGDVANHLGVDPDRPVDFSDPATMRRTIEAITNREVGRGHVTPSQIDGGMAVANQPPAPQETIGLSMPKGAPRWAKVVGYFGPENRYATVRFEDGSHRDYETSDLLNDMTEAPPRPGLEVAAPAGATEPLSEADRQRESDEIWQSEFVRGAMTNPPEARGEPSLFSSNDQARGVDLGLYYLDLARNPRYGLTTDARQQFFGLGSDLLARYGAQPQQFSPEQIAAASERAAQDREKQRLGPLGERAVTGAPPPPEPPAFTPQEIDAARLGALGRAPPTAAGGSGSPALTPEEISLGRLGSLGRAAPEGGYPPARAEAAAPADAGTVKQPVKIETPQDIALAERHVDTDPTPAQAAAGVYEKGHADFQGIPVTIENPAGGVRRGIAADGKPWQVTLQNPYGYVKRTEGNDGEHLDVYLGPHPKSQRAFVVDQKDPQTGAFDESKTILGARTPAEAAAIYDAGFSDGSGPSRRAAITPMSVDAFKDWAASPASKGPAAPPAPSEPGPAAAAPQPAIQQPAGPALKKRPVMTVNRRGEPMGLAEFLARNGGVQDQGGELRAMDAHLWHRDKPFMPRLVRADGRPLDSARELAQEHRYMPREDPNRPPDLSINDLIERLQDDLNGRSVYSENDRDLVEAGDLTKGQDRQEAETADMLFRLQQRAYDLGIPYHPGWSAEELSGAVGEREALMAGDEPREVADLEDRDIDALREARHPDETIAEAPGEPRRVAARTEDLAPAAEPDVGARGEAGRGPGEAAPVAGVGPATPDGGEVAREGSDARGERHEAVAPRRGGEPGEDVPFQRAVQPVADDRALAEAEIAHDIVAERRPTHTYTAHEKEIAGAVNAALEKIAPGARRRATGRMAGTLPSGERIPITGAYYRDPRGLAHTIAWSLESPDAVGTARHEAVHYLYRSGLLSDAEWDTLRDGARREGWAGQHGIDDRYPDASDDLKLEEAIADHYAGWRRSGGIASKLPAWLRGIFQKIDLFRRQVAAAARRFLGKDAPPEDVFARMESGEVGRRTEPATGGNEIAAAAEQRAANENDPAQMSPTEYLRTRLGPDWTLSRRRYLEPGQNRVAPSRMRAVDAEHRAAVLSAMRSGRSVPTKAWSSYRYDPEFAPLLPRDVGPDTDLRPRIAAEEGKPLARNLAESTQRELEAQGQTTLPGAERETPEQIAARQRQEQKTEAEAAMRGRAVPAKTQQPVRGAPGFGPDQADLLGGAPGPKKPVQGTLFQRPRADRPGETPPQGRDPTDATAEAMANEIRGAPPGTYARQINRMSVPRDADIKSINPAEHFWLFPHTLAKTDTMWGRFWNAWQDRDHTQAGLIHDWRQHIRPTFLKLDRAGMNKVFSAEELARLKGITPEDDGRQLVLRNADEPNAEFSKPGDIIHLSPAETKAYFERRAMFAQAWRDRIGAEAQRFGWTGEPTSAAIEEAARGAPPTEQRRLTGLAALVKGIEDQERAGYVPLMRFGDYFLSVKPKPGKGGWEGEGFPPVARFELMDGRGPWQQFTQRGFKAGDVPDAVTKRIAELRERFPESDYEVEHDWLYRKPDVLRNLDIPAVEKLFMLLDQNVTRRMAKDAYEAATPPGGLKTAKAAKELKGRIAQYDTRGRLVGGEAREQYDRVIGDTVEALREEMYKELAAGWKRQARNIPGYSNDFARATGAYMHQASRTIAETKHHDDIERAYEQIMERHPVPAVRRYTQSWRDYQDTPTNPLARAAQSLNQVGFAYALGMNPASSFVFGTHTPLSTLPKLGMGIGTTKAAGLMRTALADAYRHAKVDLRRGAYIEPTDIGRTADERQFIAGLERDGLLHSLARDDMAALNDHQAGLWGPMRGRMRRALNIATSNISVIDQANRTATALAFYRAAKDPATRAAMEKAWGPNNVLRDLLQRYGSSAETMGRFGLSEGMFAWGRENQAPVMRGPLGMLAFALHGFQTRFLSSAWNLATRMGPAGKTALGWMMAGLWAGAGIQGLPFTEDLENLGDKLSKKLFQYDPMLEARLNAMFGDNRFGKIAAQTVLYGPVGEMLGADLTHRIGFGDIATRELEALSGGVGTLAAAPDILWSHLVAAGSRARSGQYGAAAAELSPQAIRNPGLAAVDRQQGVKSQSGKTTYVAPGKLSAWETALQAAGFTPLQVARARQAQELNYERRQDQRQHIRFSNVGNPYSN